MKRWISVALAALMLLGCFAAAEPVVAQESKTYVLHGEQIADGDSMELKSGQSVEAMFDYLSVPFRALSDEGGIVRIMLLELDGFAVQSDAQVMLNGAPLAQYAKPAFAESIGCFDNGAGGMKVVFPVEVSTKEEAKAFTVAVGQETVTFALNLKHVKAFRTAQITNLQLSGAYDGARIEGDEIILDMVEKSPEHVSLNITFAQDDGEPFSKVTYAMTDLCMKPALGGNSIFYPYELKISNSSCVFDSFVTPKELNGQKVQFLLETKENVWATQDYTIRINTGAQPQNGYVLLDSRVKATESGSIAPLSGGGRYAQGAEATVHAPAVPGFAFVGWYADEQDDAGEPLSEDAEYTFTVDQEEIRLTAVYEPIAASTELKIYGRDYSVNGAVKRSDLKREYAVGTEIALGYSGTDDFRNWTNAQGRIVSKNPSYAFTLCQPTVLYANTAAAGEACAFVEFLDEQQTVVMADTWYADQRGAMPADWNVDVQSILDKIKAGQSHIEVYRVNNWTDDTVVTVTVHHEGDATVENLSVRRGEAVALTAKAIEDMQFAYWSMDQDGGRILSYKETYSFCPGEDMMVFAHYAAEGGETMPAAVTQITGVYAVQDAIYVLAAHDLVQGIALTESGILWAYAQEGEELTVDSAHANMHRANKLKLVPQSPDQKILLRSFVTGVGADGAAITVYSPVYTVSLHDVVDGWLEQEPYQGNTGNDNETPSVPIEPGEGEEDSDGDNDTPTIPIVPGTGNENETPVVPVVPGGGSSGGTVMPGENENETPIVPID